MASIILNVGFEKPPAHGLETNRTISRKTDSRAVAKNNARIQGAMAI